MFNLISVVKTGRNHHSISGQLPQAQLTLVFINNNEFTKPRVSVQANKLPHLYVLVLANKVYIDKNQQWNPAWKTKCFHS